MSELEGRIFANHTTMKIKASKIIFTIKYPQATF